MRLVIVFLAVFLIAFAAPSENRDLQYNSEYAREQLENGPNIMNEKVWNSLPQPKRLSVERFFMGTDSQDKEPLNLEMPSQKTIINLATVF